MPGNRHSAGFEKVSGTFLEHPLGRSGKRFLNLSTRRRPVAGPYRGSLRPVRQGDDLRWLVDEHAKRLEYANVVQYTGREWDSETGIYLYRHRFYQAELGGSEVETHSAMRGGGGAFTLTLQMALLAAQTHPEWRLYRPFHQVAQDVTRLFLGRWLPNAGSSNTPEARPLARRYPAQVGMP